MTGPGRVVGTQSVYRQVRNQVGGMRCVQGAWGLENKQAGAEDSVCAGDAGCGAETRRPRELQGGPGAVLLWPGASQAKRKSQRPSSTPPLCGYGGPRRSLPSLSYLLCWARLLSLLLNFLALSVNCSKVNLKNKDRT